MFEFENIFKVCNVQKYHTNRRVIIHNTNHTKHKTSTIYKFCPMLVHPLRLQPNIRQALGQCIRLLGQSSPDIYIQHYEADNTMIF